MIRIVFIFCFLLMQLLSVCQSISNTYNTKINAADKVEIKNGQIFIKQADQVIVKVEVVESSSRLLVDSVFRFLDSAKNFITIIKFINIESAHSQVNLDFKFDSPIEGMAHNIIGSGSEVIQQIFTDDKKELFLTGNIISEKGFFVAIKSRKSISVKLGGIAGVNNH